MPLYSSSQDGGRFPDPSRLGGSGPGHWQRWLARAPRAGRPTPSRFPELPGPRHARSRRRGAATLLGELAELDGERARRHLPLAVLHRCGCAWRTSSAAPGRPRRARRAALARAAGLPELEPFFPVDRQTREDVAGAAGQTRLVCSDDDPYCPEGAARAVRRAAGPARRPAPRPPATSTSDAGFGPWPAMEAWAQGRRTASRRSARRSPAARRRSACPAPPGRAAISQRAPTARRRTRSRTARPRGARPARAVSIASSSATGMISSSTSRLSTGGTKPAPMPWILCGPGGRPDSTAELAGSTATTRSSGLRSFRNSPTPVIVPPVPTPATKTSTRPSSASRSPGRSCAGGPRGWPGWRTGRAGRRRARAAIARAACDRLVHAAHRLGDLHLRAVEAQQALALAAHALRQREDAGRSPSPRRRTPARCRCCRWSPRRSWCGPARSGPSRSAASIIATPMRSLTAAARVERSRACRTARTPVGREPRQLHHRRAADVVGDVRRDP